jgi:hypothetical protein
MSIHWNESLEKLVKKEAERALALRWAHDESQRWCASWNTYLMFPSIILSTFSGAGAVGASSILPFDGSQTLVGIISLFVGLLQTIQNYFAFAKRSESHRIASLQYGKIHAELALQLSLPKSERKKAEDIIDWFKSETEKLSEISPQIPTTIKTVFHEKFKDVQVAIPTILNGLESVVITDDPGHIQEASRPNITITTVPAQPRLKKVDV